MALATLGLLTAVSPLLLDWLVIAAKIRMKCSYRKLRERL